MKLTCFTKRSSKSKLFINSFFYSLNDADQTKKMFKKVQASVAMMVEMFKKSKFFLCVAQRMNYEDGIQFTENNIVSYLAELEEYISSLITYTAFKRDEPNAAISSIPLDKLEVKEFGKRTIAIDAPIGVAIDTPEQTGIESGSLTQEDGVYSITNARELFLKFQQLHNSGTLKPIRTGNKQTAFAKEDEELSN